jgi:hypothetical protein
VNYDDGSFCVGRLADEVGWCEVRWNEMKMKIRTRGSGWYIHADLSDLDNGKARIKMWQKTTKKKKGEKTGGNKEETVRPIILSYTQRFKGNSRDKTKKKRI